MGGRGPRNRGEASRSRRLHAPSPSCLGFRPHLQSEAHKESRGKEGTWAAGCENGLTPGGCKWQGQRVRSWEILKQGGRLGHRRSNVEEETFPLLKQGGPWNHVILAY